MPCVLEAYEGELTEYHRQMATWLDRNPPPAEALQNAPDCPRLVLDTNVSLDLFVFHDPRCAALADSLERGGYEAVTDTACRAEYVRVLSYPQLDLSPLRRLRAIEAFDETHHLVDTAQRPESAKTGLPNCADPDDQKFLQLARQTDADVLLSRDKDVLALARGTQRAGLFTIASPEDWLVQSAPGPRQAERRHETKDTHPFA